MAVRQKGSAWQVDVTVGGLRAPRVSLPTRTEALAVEAQFKADMLAGREPVTPSAVKAARVDGSLADMLRLAVTRRWSGTKSERTSYATAHFWIDTLGATFQMADLTPSVVDDAISQWIASGTSSATVNRRLSALSVLMGEAIKEGHITKRFELPHRKEYEGRLRWLTEDEELVMLTYFLGDKLMHTACVLAIDTGFRAGELWRLTVRDVDLTANPPTLTAWETKGNRPRTLPLTKRAAKALEALCKGRARHELVFGGQMNNYMTSRRMARFREYAQLPPDDELCFHSLRHTCCSRMVQRGVPIVIVQRWMDHADIKTTMRYAHLAPDSFAAGLAALEKEVSE